MHCSVPAEKCVAMVINDFNALYTLPIAATSNTQSYLPSITPQITSSTNFKYSPGLLSHLTEIKLHVNGSTTFLK